MRLPEEEREHLKNPKGILFESSDKAKGYFDSNDYEMIIAVGDIVSSKLLEWGIRPDLVIVDYTVEREPAENSTKELIENYDVSTVEIKNPPGCISQQLLDVLRNLDELPLKVVVKGEEDLAAVPAVLEAPLGSLLVYGQPGKGMVFVEIDQKKKEEFRDLLDLFVEASE
ncbi:MAG: GTP-dependent dephospho-CoA kinase family protein [Candidatus Hadarchaeota archaeon]